MAFQAILTGDVVNSTRLTAAKETKLINALMALFAANDARLEFYRGDSFQAYVKKPEKALALALLSRATALRLLKGEKEQLGDVRVSIGLGDVTIPVRSLKTAKGEAFILSGRQLDAISKTNQRLAITSANALANEGLQVIAAYSNAVFDAMTGKQAEAVFELLNGETQKAAAKKIKKTKSTVHQLITAGRWPEIEKLLLHYENIVKLVI